MFVRCRKIASLFLPLSLSLTVIGSASSQETRRSDPTQMPVSGYVAGLLGSSDVEDPEVTRLLNRFFELLGDECEAVDNAPSEQLHMVDRWNRALVRNLRERHWRAEERHRDLANSGQTEEAGRVMEEIIEMEFELALIGLIAKVLGECVDARWEQLQAEAEEAAAGQGTAPGDRTGEDSEEDSTEGFLTWTASCTAPEGVDPPRTGMVQFMLPGDGSVHALMRPADANPLGSVYLEPTRLNADGSFRLATPPEAVQRVEVLAPATPDPPAQSGTIRLSGAVEGYGAWSCAGTWTRR